MLQQALKDLAMGIPEDVNKDTAVTIADDALKKLPYSWQWREDITEDHKAKLVRLLHELAHGGNEDRDYMADVIDHLELIAEEKGRGRHIPIGNFLETFPRPEWLIRDWIPANGVTILSGKGGSGKSRLLLTMACHAAMGIPKWLEGTDQLDLRIPNEGIPVLWVSWEETAGMLQQRMLGDTDNPDAVGCAPIGGVRNNFNNNLIFWRAKHGVWEPGVKGGSTHTSTMGDLTAAAHYIKAIVKRHGTKLVVLDPLAAAYRTNENDRALVRAFISEMDDWGDENDLAIVIAAHPPKADQMLYSGSTDWINAPRGSINFRLTPMVENTDGGEGQKPKDSKKRPHGMRLILMKRNLATGKIAPIWLAGAPRWKAVDPEEACWWHAQNCLPDEPGSEWTPPWKKP